MGVFGEGCFAFWEPVVNARPFRHATGSEDLREILKNGSLHHSSCYVAVKQFSTSSHFSCISMSLNKEIFIVDLRLEFLKSPKTVCMFQTIRYAPLFFLYVEIISIL